MATTYDRNLDYDDTSIRHRIRWSALFAGVIAAFGTQILLTAIGAALGISAGAIDNSRVERGVGIGAGIWMILSPIASMFVGGLVAGYFCRTRRSSALHGGLVWCLTAAIGAFMIGSMAASAFSGLASGSGNMMASLADENARNDLNREISERRDELAGSRQDERALNQAGNVGTGVAWATVAAMLFSLGAAVLGGVAGHPDNFRTLAAGARRDVTRERERRVVTPAESTVTRTRQTTIVDDDDYRHDLH